MLGDLLIWIRVGQGPTVLAVGFFLDFYFSLSPSSGRWPDIN